MNSLDRQSIITPEKVNYDYRGEFDLVVVGSGPGGSIVADVVSRKGKSVCVLEEGDFYRGGEYPGSEPEGYLMMYQDQGMRTSFGNVVMPVLQGRCLGGGMPVNMALCLEPPDSILKDWISHGIDWFKDREWLRRTVRELKEENHIKKVDERLFTNNHILFMKAMKEMGLKYEIFERNTNNCEGCGRCNYGCPIDAKVVPHLTYLKNLSERGGSIIVRAKAKRIIHDEFFAKGVEGVFVDGRGEERGYFEIKAKVVCVSCGAVNSPYLFLNSKLPRRQRGIGEMASFHPTFLMFATFGKRIDGFRGVPMAVYTEDLFDRGIVLETMFLPILSFGVPLPGIGDELLSNLMKYRNVAMAIVQVRDTSLGRVRMGLMDRPWIEYNLNEKDLEVMKEGVRLMAEGYLKAGADEVILPVRGDSIVKKKEDIDRILKNMRMERFSFFLYSAHPQGGCPMGADPARYAVRVNGELYSLRNCFVADSSLFPSPSGVNPMFSTMIFAKKVGENIASLL